MTELLAVRVHQWQAFRFRKWAEHKGVPLGMMLTEAIQGFLVSENIPQELIEEWLREYRETQVGNDQP